MNAINIQAGDVNRGCSCVGLRYKSECAKFLSEQYKLRQRKSIFFWPNKACTQDETALWIPTSNKTLLMFESKALTCRSHRENLSSTYQSWHSANALLPVRELLSKFRSTAINHTCPGWSWSAYTSSAFLVQGTKIKTIPRCFLVGRCWTTKLNDYSTNKVQFLLNPVFISHVYLETLFT